jgi:formylglycine-generating enzyme required for sulfatase activity
MLKKGHHGVTLDADDWDRLVTWIDLNCPYHGTWGEDISSPGTQRERRRELSKRYANVDDDPEAVPERDGDAERRRTDHAVIRISTPHSQSKIETQKSAIHNVPGWPFEAVEAKRRQYEADSIIQRRVELAPGIGLDLMRVPAGEFLMGNRDGGADEQPVSSVHIERSFWMARGEISNAEFACFDPAHDSRVEDKNTYQFGIHGYPANQPDQPVVRVSWQEAMAFCRWLSDRTGQQFSLPTEAQWEWACRAGASTPFSFGSLDSDFSGHANFADAKLSEFASDPYTVDKPLANPTLYDDWIPKDARFNDGALIAVASGRYAPNAWGLHDLHGNVAEWTRSTYTAYPSATDGRDDEQRAGRKVVRGGSWRDVPTRGTASFRLSYEPWQRVYNVGFRVVCEGERESTGKTISTADVDRSQKNLTR